MKRIISEILKEISDYLEFKGENIFKVKAYREASKIIENLPYDIKNISDIEKLKDISGIGQTILLRIREIVQEGRSAYLDELKKEYPLDLEDLISIPGLGVKKVRLFYDSLGVRDIDDLKDAIYSGKLLELPRVGKKVIESIKRGIEFKEKNRGFPLPLALDMAKDFTPILRALFPIVYITGELRRKEEFIKSFDFLVLESKESEEKIREYIEIVKEEAMFPYKRIFYRRGKIRGIIYITTPNLLWHTLFYSTGCEGHVLYVQKRYEEMRLSFWKERFKNEYMIYKKVDLPFIPPILREARGEFTWFREPHMISKKDLKGEFHVHSTWSDGKATIPEILEEAYIRGYNYIGISDHSASLTVARGLSLEDILKKEKEILSLREKGSRVFPLFGTEVDIGPDGTLDYPEEVLKRFDYVIAAIHTNFGMGLEENTRRIISALRNPYVVAFAHPTGRELGIRPGYEFDKEEVFKEAEKNGVLLEINGTPRRMDLDSYELSKLRNTDIKFILSSDAHHLSSLANIENSLTIINKSNISPYRILNTYDLEEVLDLFKEIREKKLRRVNE